MVFHKGIDCSSQRVIEAAHLAGFFEGDVQQLFGDERCSDRAYRANGAQAVGDIEALLAKLIFL
jgi:hypothetical protein